VNSVQDVVRRSAVPARRIELVPSTKQHSEAISIDFPVLGQHVDHRQRHDRVVRVLPRARREPSQLDHALYEVRRREEALPERIPDRESVERSRGSFESFGRVRGHA
jgi:hypothetical protein